MRSFRGDRPGFTLIELLVVIAVIAVLASLAAMAVFRVKAARQSGRTEDSLARLHQALESQMRAVRETADEAGPTHFMRNIAGEDRRAGALCRKMWLRAEFPHSFEEVRWVAKSYPQHGTTGLRSFGGRGSYLREVGLLSGDPGDESAALLYLALQVPRRGQGADSLGEGLGVPLGTVDVGGKEFRCYLDSWGKPVRFIRRPLPDSRHNMLLLEMSDVRYGVGTVNRDWRDRDDPEGTLLPDAPLPFGKPGNVWHPEGRERARLLACERRADGTPHDFDPHNLMPTAWSAGPDGAYCDLSQVFGTSDDLFSFRMMKGD
jgi:prepilin-type N-terminal cleavage/methylation domain-containing protein